MSLLLKVVLSFLLVAPVSFANKPLAYQRSETRFITNYMQTQPTYEELGKILTLWRLDPSIAVFMKKWLKERNIEMSSRMPGTELIGNKLVIEGIKNPIVFENSYDLSMSYDGEKIILTNPKNFENTVQEIERFFSKKKVVSIDQEQSVPKFGRFSILSLPFYLSQRANALVFLAAVPPLVIQLASTAAVFVAGGTVMMAWAKGTIPLPEEYKNWIFGDEALRKELKFKCIKGTFTIVNGQFSIGIDFIPNYFHEKKTVGQFQTQADYILKAYDVTISDTKREERQRITFLAKNFEVAKESEQVISALTPSQQVGLAKMASSILGDGTKPVCKPKEDEFVDKETKDKYHALNVAFEKLRSDKVRSLVDDLKTMEPSQNPTRTK